MRRRETRICTICSSEYRCLSHVNRKTCGGECSIRYKESYLKSAAVIEYQSEYIKRPDIVERRKKYAARYYSDPKNRERIRIRQAEYRRRNREKIRRRGRSPEQREKNRIYMIAYNRKKSIKGS